MKCFSQVFWKLLKCKKDMGEVENKYYIVLLIIYLYGICCCISWPVTEVLDKW